MMQSSPVLSLSPSFTSYSSTRLTEIAARVVEEFRAESNPEDDEDFSSFCADYKNGVCQELECEVKAEITEKEEEEEAVAADEHEDENQDEDEDEEFEFAFVARDLVCSPTPADEIFYNGQIRPIYPLFDTSLLLDEPGMEKSSKEAPPARLPLRKLFLEEREASASSSCSSSEADELDGVAPGTYCVWTPKTAVEGQCKKSNSTGSSKRWRFRDLLHRSNSEGKDRFVLLSSPSVGHGKKSEEKGAKIETSKVSAAGKVVPEQYVKNGGDRRQASFLPYRQDLVGLFSNVNGLSRNLRPF